MSKHEHPSIETFWKWFSKNEKRYRNIVFTEDENAQQDLLVDVLGYLNEYNPELYLEFDNNPETNKHILTITANGMEGFIEAAEILAEAAPTIEGWEIQALKQPNTVPFTLDLETGKIESSTVWAEPLTRDDNPGRLGIKLFIKDVNKLSESPYFSSSIYTLVETVIGEKSLAKDISILQIAKEDETFVQAHCVPLMELSNFIKDYKLSLKESAHQNHDKPS